MTVINWKVEGIPIKKHRDAASMPLMYGKQERLVIGLGGPVHIACELGKAGRGLGGPVQDTHKCKKAQGI